MVATPLAGTVAQRLDSRLIQSVGQQHLVPTGDRCVELCLEVEQFEQLVQLAAAAPGKVVAQRLNAVPFRSFVSSSCSFTPLGCRSQGIILPGTPCSDSVRQPRMCQSHRPAL